MDLLLCVFPILFRVTLIQSTESIFSSELESEGSSTKLYTSNKNCETVQIVITEHFI